MRVLALIAIFCAAAFAQPPVGFDPSSLDRSIDPCVNFYQFACGGWKKVNPRPADQGSWGSFDVLQDRNRIVLHNILESVSTNRANRTAIEQKIGDYFAACMDEKTIDAKGLAALKADLDLIAAIRNKPGVTDAVIHLYKIGAAPFFRFGSEPDPKNSTSIIANVDQGGLALPDRDYYFRDDAKSVDLRNKYVAHLQKIFELLGASAAEAAKKAQVVMKIETTLAKGSLDRVARRDPNNVYHKLTTAELISLAPGFDWQKFFDATGSPKFDSLDVSVPPFVRAMESVIVENSLDDLKTYLVWNLLTGARGNLPTAFEREFFDFFGRNLGGAKEMRARWKRCTDQVDNQLPDALGRMFVEKTLGDEGKRRMQQMVDALEKALERDIKSLDWMTAKTKEQALIKLHAIINKVGNKATWLDYAMVEIARNDAYGNAARTSLFELRRQLAKIGKPLDKTDWAMSQPTVNAYYDPQENDINFPAGILQPPFYDNKMDDAVNFGAIGAVIGHELTHGFDDQGRQFDAQGNLRDWWTTEDADAFKKRAQCFVDQYAGFTAVDNVKLNGELTLGENTADNGGLRIAYMALMDTLAGKTPPKRDGFTAEQRLFLGWSQVWCTNQSDESARTQAQSNVHSTGQFRVNGVVQNMPEFQKAFACKAGQPMVKSPACRVW